jgi:hypothetical protein
MVTLETSYSEPSGMTTETHHQFIDDFIQKSTVTDDRRNEEREKATTINRDAIKVRI